MTSGYLSSRSRIFSDIREGLNWGTSEGRERRVSQEARQHLGSVIAWPCLPGVGRGCALGSGLSRREAVCLLEPWLLH